MPGWVLLSGWCPASACSSGPPPGRMCLLCLPLGVSIKALSVLSNQDLGWWVGIPCEWSALSASLLCWAAEASEKEQGLCPLQEASGGPSGVPGLPAGRSAPSAPPEAPSVSCDFRSCVNATASQCCCQTPGPGLVVVVGLKRCSQSALWPEMAGRGGRKGLLWLVALPCLSDPWHCCWFPL